MTLLAVLNRVTNQLKEHRIESPRLNAELLLASSLHLSREELYVHFYDLLRENEKEKLEVLVERRISGEPLQYVLGRQEFWSVDLKVDPRVLIPRPETELLVEQALSTLSPISFGRIPSALEIGTGSGAIAIALAQEVEALFLVATDISQEALMSAKENARATGVLQRIEFVTGDLFGPFRAVEGREPFDLILSNPPYIVHSEIGRLGREVKDHEPMIALDGGEDGLDVCRKIIQQGPLYLGKGGWLLLEIGQGQGPEVREEIGRSGSFSAVELVSDLSGIERVVKTQRR
jgi:release factor glutamine methyltransferase